MNYIHMCIGKHSNAKMELGGGGGFFVDSILVTMVDINQLITSLRL